MIRVNLPEDETRERGVLVEFEGTCGHVINVLVRASRADVKAVKQAMSHSEPHALLRRFCPFCMQNSEFQFPLHTTNSVSLRLKVNHYSTLSLSMSPSGSLGSYQNLDLIKPSERAYRMWEGALMPADEDQAERDLRLAADIFDRKGMFMQRLGTLEDLTELLDRQGRGDEAAALRQQIKEEIAP